LHNKRVMHAQESRLSSMPNNANDSFPSNDANYVERKKNKKYIIEKKYSENCAHDAVEKS